MGGRNNSKASAAGDNKSSKTKRGRIIHSTIPESIATPTTDHTHTNDSTIMSNSSGFITSRSITPASTGRSRSDVSGDRASQVTSDFPDFITGAFVSSDPMSFGDSKPPVGGSPKNHNDPLPDDGRPSIRVTPTKSQPNDVSDIIGDGTDSDLPNLDDIDPSASGVKGGTQSESDESSNDDKSLTPKDVEQVLKTDDGKIIVVKKDSKKGDGLTIGKLMVSGSAAITASIITTRLAGAVNGLLIVGVSSVVIAVLNEIYRRLFAKMKKISAQAVVSMPLDKILPDKMARKVNDDLQSVLQDTSALPVIQEIKTTDAEGGSNGSHSIEADMTRSKVNAEDVKSAYESTSSSGVNGDLSAITGDDDEIFIPRLRDLVHGDGLLKGTRKWLGIEWQSWSWITKSMVIVLSFTLLSAGVSVAMSSIMERPEINVTNVTKHDVKDLSDAEKNAIKDAAIQAVQDQLNGISSKQSELDNRISSLESMSGKTPSSNENDTQSPSPSASGSDPADHKSDVEVLKKTVADLQTEVDALKAVEGGGSGVGDDSDVKSRIDALTSRMDAIDAKIQRLESNGGVSSNPVQPNGSQAG